MQDTVVALLQNGEVVYGDVHVGSGDWVSPDGDGGYVRHDNEESVESIIWQQGAKLPNTYYPIVPLEEYHLALAA